MSIFRILLVIVCSASFAQAGLVERHVDFSSYDQPLYAQVVNRIKAKVLARLGEGINTRERYFIIPFAYQNRNNDPAFSHSFISVIRVFPDNKNVQLTPGLKTRSEANREFEAFTISWLPRDFATNTHLCVFDGPAARIIPEANDCPLSPGRNFNLAETLQLCSHDKLALAMWGPYEIAKPGFDLGVRRKNLLDGGTIKYKADDRLTRKDHIAINCFHAMAGLEELYPNGGLFGTGFKMWGFNGTARVLIEYSHRARYKGLLLEPVDEKNDRYGFVYATSRDGKIPYNPLRNASAYQQ
jgi:hypothetical protein